MKKQKKEKNQELEPKEEETNLQKILGTLYRMFVKEDKLSQQISQALVIGSYFQIFSAVNVIALFTIFSNTNSNTYTYIIASLSIAMFLLDIFPKISKKHFVFNFISIVEGLIIISMVISSKILLDNYFIFIGHCTNFKLYYTQRPYVIGPKDNVLAMCETVTAKFMAEIIVQALFFLGKGIHVLLYVRAYRQAKEKFEEEEKKKRRKDRYNDMMRRRYIFNEKRRA